MTKLFTTVVMLLSSLWAIAADGEQWTDIWSTATEAYLEGGEYQWTDGDGNRQTERCKENTTIDGSTITINLNHAFNGGVDLRFFTKLNLESSKIYKISYKLSSTQNVRIERPSIYCDGSTLSQGAYQKSNIDLTANDTPVEVVFDVDHVGTNNGRGVCLYLRPSNWADNTVLTLTDVKFEYMAAASEEAPQQLFLCGSVFGGARQLTKTVDGDKTKYSASVTMLRNDREDVNEGFCTFYVATSLTEDDNTVYYVSSNNGNNNNALDNGREYPMKKQTLAELQADKCKEMGKIRWGGEYNVEVVFDNAGTGTVKMTRYDHKVTFNDSGVATLGLTYPVSIPNDVAVYAVAAPDTNNELVLTKVSLTDNILPANTGVVIKGSAGQTVSFNNREGNNGDSIATALSVHNGNDKSDGTWYILGSDGINLSALQVSGIPDYGTAYYKHNNGTDALAIKPKTEKIILTNELATYCPTVGLDFTGNTDVAAYKAMVKGDKVELTRVDKVAAGEGVVVRSLSGDAVEANVNEDATATANEDNQLIGVQADIENLASEENGKKNYILNDIDGNVGFYAANNQPVGAGHAYLQIDATNSAKSFTISFGDEVDGIAEIGTQAKSANAAIYNLRGQRVANPAKGLYIQNGKKVIIK